MIADGLVEVVATAEKIVAGLEPGELLASDAAAMVETFARLERLAAAGRAVCAKRVAESKVWSRGGEKSPAHWLAKESGTSVGDAAGLLDSVGKLDGLPHTAESFRRGELSGAQVRAVADAAAVDPSAERGLLDAAGRLSLHELEDEARRVRHAADGVDEEARYRRIHRDRYLRTWTDDDGAGCGTWRTTADRHAQILAALRRQETQIFHDARREGRRERPEAYAVDALHQLLTTGEQAGTGDETLGHVTNPHATDHAPAGASHDHETATGADGTPAKAPTGTRARRRSGGSDAKIIVRVDHTALMRGAVEPGELCEISGIGPIPVSVVRDWVTNDAFLAAIVTDGVDIRSVVHLGRRATALQRTALEWLAPTCTVEGCSASVRLEIDHRDDWARTRRTVLDSLDRLCPHHHALKTRHNYGLAPGTGTRPLLPPDHPDHPDRTKAPPPGGADGAPPPPDQPTLLDTG